MGQIVPWIGRTVVQNAYVVADLDYVEGYRGAARIVYERRRTGEGAIWITVDHYNSFTAVPVGQ